jgi:uncharacterized protein
MDKPLICFAYGCIQSYCGCKSAIVIPKGDWVKLVVVEGQFDVVDDWLVEYASANDICISGDILLAVRCFEIGAQAPGHRGDAFT